LSRTDRLDALTPEQEALLPQVRDEWIGYGLSTEPADRAEAEAGVAQAYREAGLEPPLIVLWLDSPLAGAFGQGMLRQVWDQVRAQVWALRDQVVDQVRDQVGNQVWAQVWAQVGDQVRDQVVDQVWAQVWDQVWDQVRDQVRAQVGAQVRALWDQVGAQVGNQVWDQVGDQVRDQVWDQVGAQVVDQVRDQVRAQIRDWYSGVCFGQHETWLSFHACMHALGIDTAGRLEGHYRVAASAGWWWPLQGAVVLTERPTALHRDGQGRLHSETGAAVVYPDGYGVHAWHGTRVPADLIETGWDTTRIMSEPNTEVRRCAIERLGWDRFVVDAGLSRVGEPVPDPGNPGHELALYDVPERIYGDADVRVLLCTNGTVERDGTRRRFGLAVPADMPDPLTAAAWGYQDPDHPVQLTPEMYTGIARRT